MGKITGDKQRQGQGRRLQIKRSPLTGRPGGQGLQQSGPKGSLERGASVVMGEKQGRLGIVETQRGHLERGCCEPQRSVGAIASAVLPFTLCVLR